MASELKDSNVTSASLQTNLMTNTNNKDDLFSDAHLTLLREDLKHEEIVNGDDGRTKESKRKRRKEGIRHIQRIDMGEQGDSKTPFRPLLLSLAPVDKKKDGRLLTPPPPCTSEEKIIKPRPQTSIHSLLPLPPLPLTPSPSPHPHMHSSQSPPSNPNPTSTSPTHHHTLTPVSKPSNDPTTTTSPSSLTPTVEEGEEGKRRRRRRESCIVCGDTTLSLSVHSPFVCDSCRTFFRRAIRDRSYQAFKCVREGCDEGGDGEEMCPVGKERRQCQFCRFSACLKCGMEVSLPSHADQSACGIASSRGLYRRFSRHAKTPQGAPYLAGCWRGPLTPVLTPRLKEETNRYSPTGAEAAPHVPSFPMVTVTPPVCPPTLKYSQSPNEDQYAIHEVTRAFNYDSHPLNYSSIHNSASIRNSNNAFSHTQLSPTHTGLSPTTTHTHDPALLTHTRSPTHIRLSPSTTQTRDHTLPTHARLSPTTAQSHDSVLLTHTQQSPTHTRLSPTIPQGISRPSKLQEGIPSPYHLFLDSHKVFQANTKPSKQSGNSNILSNSRVLSPQCPKSLGSDGVGREHSSSGIQDSLTPQDLEEIRQLQSSYIGDFDADRSSPLDDCVPRSELGELYTCFVERRAKFLVCTPLYSTVAAADRPKLLHVAVAMSTYITGAHFVDTSEYSWPQRRDAKYVGREVTVLSPSSIRQLLSHQQFLHVMKFYASFSEVLSDQTIAILMQVMSLFYPEEGLQSPRPVEEGRRHYLVLLSRYLASKYGQQEGARRLAILLTSQQEARQLVDILRQVDLTPREPGVELGTSKAMLEDRMKLVCDVARGGISLREGMECKPTITTTRTIGPMLGISRTMLRDRLELVCDAARGGIGLREGMECEPTITTTAITRTTGPMPGISRTMVSNRVELVCDAGRGRVGLREGMEFEPSTTTTTSITTRDSPGAKDGTKVEDVVKVLSSLSQCENPHVLAQARRILSPQLLQRFLHLVLTHPSPSSSPPSPPPHHRELSIIHHTHARDSPPSPITPHHTHTHTYELAAE